MFTAPLNILLLFMVTTPLVGWMFSKTRLSKICDGYAALGFGISSWFLYLLYREVSEEHIVLRAYSLPFGSCLEIDALSIFMASAFILIGLMATIFSPRYMEKETGVADYYTLVLGMVAGMVGLVFAGDFLTFFVFWELMSMTSYVLVAFRKRSPAAVEASYKYLIMSAAGSMILAYGMSLLFGMTGTLNFALIRATIQTRAHDAWLSIVLSAIAIGFGIKAAIVPLHMWLPDAHSEAPSPVSALLSGVLIVCGLYGISRFPLLLFNSVRVSWGFLAAIVSIITMIVGNLMALVQSDVKRLLAYSTVAHIGYVMIGIAIGTESGLTGAFLHILNHAIMKGLAFLAAGALIFRTETREIGQFAGIRKPMPLSTLLFSISLFGLLGLPPFSGFVSKFLLFTAAFEANAPALAIVGIVNTVLSAGYYLRVVKTVMLDSPSENTMKLSEAPRTMLLSMCILAFLTTFLGVYPGPVISYAKRAAEAALNIEQYVDAIVHLVA